MSNDYEEIARNTAAALESYGQLASELAKQETQAQSSDGRVIVTATGGGTITDITFRRGATRYYDSVALSEVVTRTIRSAQVRARREFEDALNEALPDEVVETDRLIRNSYRE